MLHDARLPSWSIAGTAGGTVVLRGVVPAALGDAALSLWLGGSIDDVDDLAGATEVVAVADGPSATWTIAVPTDRDPVPLRWTVDGVPATVGALIPSRVGALVRELEVQLGVGEVELDLSLGGYDDAVADDTLGVLDPDTAIDEFRRLMLLFTGQPEVGTEDHDRVLESVSGFEQALPIFELEQPVDLHAALRNTARFMSVVGSQMGLYGLMFGAAQTAIDDTEARVTSAETLLGEHDARFALKADSPFVQPDDPALDGTSNTAIGTIWVRTDEHPHPIHVRGTDATGTETWVRIDAPGEEAP